MPRGRTDLRNHGAAYGCSWWRPAGYALLGRARCVTAERNGLDVLADERLPFGALAEADLQPTKRRPPVLIRRSPDRTASLLVRKRRILSTPSRIKAGSVHHREFGAFHRVTGVDEVADADDLLARPRQEHEVFQPLVGVVCVID